MEVWTGDGWAPYLDLDNVLRHGERLTEAQALARLHETRERAGIPLRLSDEDARLALHDRLRRA